METKSSEHSRCKFLVSKFLIKDQLNWAREIKIAKKLLKLYPDFKIWSDLKLKFKLNSLAFFLTEEGKGEMSVFEFNKSKENVLDLLPQNSEVIGNEKIGKDVIKDSPKPLSFKDFLNKKF